MSAPSPSASSKRLALPCVHIMGSTDIPDVASTLAKFSHALAIEAEAEAEKCERTVFVLGPGSPGDLKGLATKITTKPALAMAAAKMAEQVAEAQAAGKIAPGSMLVCDTGPAVHEINYYIWDTQPNRALVNEAIVDAVTPKGWRVLDSMTPTLGRPDHRGYWTQSCTNGYSCQSVVNLQLSTILLHAICEQEQ